MISIVALIEICFLVISNRNMLKAMLYPLGLRKNFEELLLYQKQKEQGGPLH